MNPEQYLQFVLASLGLLGDERFDAKYTAILSRELEYIKTQTYDVVYPEYKSKALIPVSHEIPAGAETWTYRQWDMFGAAEIISNFADDLKFVDVMKEEFTHPIKSIGDAYQYSIQDLRASAYSGVGIERARAMAARRAVENRFDIWGAIGNSIVGAYGILNQPNATLVSVITGAWDTATVATGEQVVADLNALVDGILAANLDTFVPDTLLMDPVNYRYAMHKKYSDYSDKYALQVFKETNPFITRVEPWHRCSTADAPGTGPRFVCFKRSPEVATYEIPQEFEQVAPQPKNLSFVVPCHARVAGVASPYPLGIGYMDGC